MPYEKRHGNKNCKAWPLWNSGCFTWNVSTRVITFLRAGNPDSDREEMQKGTYFRVEGDDIKLLYQVLHEHFMSPKGLKTRSWSPHAAVPYRAHTISDPRGGTMLRVEPHKDYEDVDDGDDGADT